MTLTPPKLVQEKYPDSDLAIAQGKYGSYGSQTVIHQSGENPTSADGADEEVWSGDAAYPAYPATALMVELAMGANQAGMVGQEIEINGLDADWGLSTEVIALDGTDTSTPVTLETPLIRVNSMRVLADVVTDQTVLLQNAANNVNYGVIVAGHNKSQMAMYSVPLGYTFYMTGYSYGYYKVAAQDPNGVEFHIWTADRVNSYEFEIQTDNATPKQAPDQYIPFKPYFKVTQKHDIKMTGTAEGAAAHTHASISGILVAN